MSFLSSGPTDPDVYRLHVPRVLSRAVRAGHASGAPAPRTRDPGQDP